MAIRVAVIVGSLRMQSYNSKMAKVLMSLAPSSLRCEIVEIGELPLYNQDSDEGSPPEAWTAFRERMREFEGVLFVTPEYNRSVPAVLKNAIDVGSRPYGKSIWNGKPAGIMTVTPGAIGGFGANHHLRQSLVFLNMPAMQQPEAYVGGAAELFDEAGNLVNESTRDFVTGFMEGFARWVETHASG
jgi:chromate reductase